MDKKISFIGTGNMGGAIIQAACRALDPAQVSITDYSLDKARQLANGQGCQVSGSNREAVLFGDYIFLCVKPQVIGSVLSEISPVLDECLSKGEPKVLVSIAAGVTIDALREKLSGDGRRVPIIRIMPNTPVSIGKGMLALASGADVTDGMIKDIKAALTCAGRLEQLPEALMDQFTAIGGCAPAFVYLFIEALADGGVMTGLSRSQALTYAAQTVLGAAAMVLETQSHPGVLKDNVCSPGGSTIAGVAALEAHGFRSAAIDAVLAAYQKNQELGK